MSVDRSIQIRLLTTLVSFSEIVGKLLDSEFSINENGTITSLSVGDLDDFDYIEYKSYDEVKEVLDRREEQGNDNYIVIWMKDFSDSLLIRATRLECDYEGYTNQYELTFGLGYGIRIEGADRYTDYGVYLNKLLPVFIANSMYICEINCTDSDC